MILGTFVIYTIVIVNLEEIVAQLDVTQSIFKRTTDHVKAYLIVQDIPEELRRKAADYLDRLWVKQRGIGGTRLLQYLPLSLRCQVVNELLENKIGKLFFIKDSNINVKKLFTSLLELEYFMPGEFLFMHGEPAVQLFMLVSGSVELVKDDLSTVYTTLENSCVIGEGEFFSRQSQPCSGSCMY